MTRFGGKVFFLDRDNINTDEIIPAKYLTEIDKMPLKAHLLEDIKIDGLDPLTIPWDNYGVIVSKANFGCGSSREMAVWAFQINRINVIIATNFARIFRENAFNSGMLAIELKAEIIDELFKAYQNISEVYLDVDIEQLKLHFCGDSIHKEVTFKLDAFQKDVVKAGGLVELAAEKY
jgi:3-isopropylmalate/(R)-2-methylmalate dehydratase small subunit